MNSATVVLDTNVIIPAVLFGGLPREILSLVSLGKIKAVISPVLLAELFDILHKKFPDYQEIDQTLEKRILGHFKIVNPEKQIKICRDLADNCVLEAGMEGEVDYIITGDQDLLILGKYKKILIIPPAKFYADYSITSKQ